MYCHGDNLSSWGNYFILSCMWPYIQTIAYYLTTKDKNLFCLICRVGSENLILGTMWCRHCRHCYLELIGQSLFRTQLTDSWPLREEEVSFFVEALSWETILTNIKTQNKNICPKGSLTFVFLFNFFKDLSLVFILVNFQVIFVSITVNYKNGHNKAVNIFSSPFFTRRMNERYS